MAIKGQDEHQAHVVCRSNLKYLYWSFRQQLAHHTINGCNMRPGDLCGTGTISGPVRPSSLPGDRAMCRDVHQNRLLTPSRARPNLI